VVAIPRSEANSFGIVKVNSDYQVLDFWEKPGDTILDSEWYIPKNLREKYKLPEDFVFASMSMYLIGLELLNNILTEKKEMMDFGKEIIPFIIKNYKVHIAIHDSYWEDIGTLSNFHKANIDLTDSEHGFNVYDPSWKTLSRPSLCAPSIFMDCTIKNSLIADGCHIKKSTFIHTVIGQRTIVKENSYIENTVIMGSDWLETKPDKECNKKNQIPNIGIGKNCVIKNAIIDKNARIGDNVILTNEKGHKNHISDQYVIKDGIIVIPSKAIIPNNFKV
ncbi:MAG: sugar phosphate nucleotidyltransferase, partial [Brevinema sp.]